jgi:hypothetical protein
MRVNSPLIPLSFKGKTMSVGDIMEFVLMETPACQFKGCLKGMEEAERLRAVNPAPNRRRGTFPDERMLTSSFYRDIMGPMVAVTGYSCR